MRLSISKLIGRKVYTRSQVYLGKVRDVIVDLDSETIEQYEVSKFGFWSQNYLINQKQVVGYKDNMIIVEDAKWEEVQTEKESENSNGRRSPAMLSDTNN